ncbi:MAG: DASS family sodium-coupled anion symporter [Deltaproteobacteria bacterium]|nr:DASS family sodium-coupled anion symporter [Deltaproteobacteria bacterium]
MLPVPAGVVPRAWHLLAIFVATIVGIMTQALPMTVVALLGLAATLLTRTLAIDEALSGFGHGVVWLVVFAFFIARGMLKSGLGMRIAYLFLAALGRKTLGLAYALIGADLVMAPAIPTNTARGGGVMFPIVRSVASTCGSEPDDGTARKLGAFLVLTSFQGTLITSAMFLTAMAANPLMAEMARSLGVEITWGVWFRAAVVPGLLSLAVMPALVYRLFPPEVTETPQAQAMARERLARLGPMTAHESIMLGVFVLLLLLWVFGAELQVHPTTAALVGVCVLLLTGVLRWKDLHEEEGAWTTLVWLGILFTLATFLEELGLISWFTGLVSGELSGMGWVPALILLSLVYFYCHYFFASDGAQIFSMYLPFVSTAVALGVPPLLAALTLAFLSNMFGGLTHYGTGPAPVFFGAGYVPVGTWWKVGGIVSISNFLIWVFVGGAWWKVLGLW